MSEQQQPTPEQPDIMSEQRNTTPAPTNNAMPAKLKLLGGGLVAGLLVIFAIVGVQSMFADKPPAEPSQMGANGWQPYSPNIIGLPGSNTPSSNQDVPLTGQNNRLNMELVGEPKDEPLEKPTPAAPVRPTQPPVSAAPAAPPATPQVTAQPAPEPTTEPVVPAANTGRLEIVLQAAENGKPIKANVYVQKTSGINVNSASFTSQASFDLKPGTYRISARTEGRGTLSRDITVPAGAVVNEIFQLPALASAPANPPPVSQPAPPVANNPPPPAPQAPVGSGKLRLVALAIADGSPVKVDFTISRLNGSVIDRVRNVSMAEFDLPAEEFVASFDYQGRQGYKSLMVQDGKTHTHTFNIRQEQPQPQQPMAAPPQQSFEDIIRQQGQLVPPPTNVAPNAPPQAEPQQPQQSLESIIMQQLQQELQKNLNK